MCRPFIAAACLAASWSILALSNSSAEETKSVRVPDVQKFGSYVVLPIGKELVYTTRDYRNLTREQRKAQEIPDSLPLRGLIRYPDSKRLVIDISADENMSLGDKMRHLMPLAKDVDTLACWGPLDELGAKLLGQFTNLRGLYIEASEALESEAAAKSLSELKSLEVFSLIGPFTFPDEEPQERPFGSTAFCRAMASLKRLRSLGITCEKLTNKDIALLADHPSLEKLYLESPRAIIAPQTVRAFGGMQKLREITFLCTPDVVVADLEPICRIKSLESLVINTDSPEDFEREIKALRSDIFFYSQPVGGKKE